MQTNFTEAQRADPAVANSESVIRKCVHCGFCTATCPTYVLLGDERDSPRGRIYLMKEMLEAEATPSPEVVRHIDRCLSCLACMTTCPSGVNYMQLVDHARAYIEDRYRRPWPDRAWRWFLAKVLPYPRRLRLALGAARLGRPFAPLLARHPALRPGASMLALAPRQVPKAEPVEQAVGASRGRVVLLQGCAEQVLAPQIRAAAVRLLNRAGYEVTFAKDEGCCGALEHHMGREAASHAAAVRNVRAWSAELDAGATAILTTVSGCGTTMKNYGFQLRQDPEHAAAAKRISDQVRDISEFLAEAGLPPPVAGERPIVAYHAPCSLQHGQKVTRAPKTLLIEAGFSVRDVPEGHLCCGSAGTYNILQAEIAGRLRERKQANIAKTGADVVVTGNIGCMTQISQGGALPVLHLVELLDWATGGPRPQRLERRQEQA